MRKIIKIDNQLILKRERQVVGLFKRSRSGGPGIIHLKINEEGCSKRIARQGSNNPQQSDNGRERSNASFELSQTTVFLNWLDPQQAYASNLRANPVTPPFIRMVVVKGHR